MSKKFIIIMVILLILLGSIGIITYNIYIETTGIEVIINNDSNQTFKNIKNNTVCVSNFTTRSEDSLKLVCENESGEVYEEVIIDNYKKGYVDINIKEKDGNIIYII